MPIAGSLALSASANAADVHWEHPQWPIIDAMIPSSALLNGAEAARDKTGFTYRPKA